MSLQKPDQDQEEKHKIALDLVAQVQKNDARANLQPGDIFYQGGYSLIGNNVTPLFSVGNFEPDNIRIQIASSSKIIFFFALAKLLEQPNQSISVGYGFFTDTLNKAIEWGKESFNELLSSGILEILTAKLFKDNTDESRAFLLKLKNAEFGSDSFDKLIAQLKGLIENVRTDETFEINFKQLAFNALTLSGNYGLAICKAMIVNIVGENVPAPSEKILRFMEFLKKIAPDYEPLTTYDDLYLQNGPNTSNPRAFLQNFASVVNQLIDDPNNSNYKIIFDALSETKTVISLGIRGDARIQNLLNKGWRLLEKTGNYGPIYYIPCIANQGFPCHMSIVNYICLISPEGARHFFGFTRQVKMTLPPNGEDGLPDDNVESVEKELNEIFNMHAPSFSKEMVDKILEALQIADE